MKIIEYEKQTKWRFVKRFFVTKKFQGLVLSIDFDVPQGFGYQSVCVLTCKLFFLTMWLGIGKKTVGIPYLSKYKAGGIVGGGFYKDVKNFFIYNNVSHCYNCRKKFGEPVKITQGERLLCTECANQIVKNIKTNGIINFSHCEARSNRIIK